MRIIQITEKDKMELSELGQDAVEAVQEFLECLDKVTEGEISEAMAKRYGERRGVPGSGRGRYSRRMGERRGVAGTGRYGRREGGGGGSGYGQRMGERYGEHYPEDEEEEFGERSGGGGYGNRYEY